MKILTIVENLGLGGTERVAQNFSIGYKNSGCEVKVLATKTLGIRAEYLQEAHIDVLDGTNNLPNSIKKINDWQPDIIHIHRPGYYNEMNGLLTLIKYKGCKVIETNIFARPDYSKSAYLVDAHLHLSHWNLWKWQKWTRNLNQLGVVIPNLIDCDKITEKVPNKRHSRLEHLPSDAIILGRIGQPSVAKWNEVIFEVLQELLKKNKSYYLALVGLPEALKSKLKTYSNIVQDHVVLIDPIYDDTELNTLYQSFDIFLHAAKIGESFGMVLAEAHLNKVPIVTLQTVLKDNTQNELVGNGRGGFVVTDERHMVEAIEILADDPNLREKMGRMGSKYIRENFEMGSVTQKTLKVCHILLKNLNRKQTMNELEKNGITTSVSETFMQQLKKNVMGKTSVRDRVLFYLIHLPVFYKNYLKLKGIDENIN